MQIEIVKFSQIVDRLPDDFWAKQRNEKQAGEFDDETVLLIRGDAAFLAGRRGATLYWRMICGFR